MILDPRLKILKDIVTTMFRNISLFYIRKLKIFKNPYST